MSETTTEKPVYTTGSSLSDIFKSNEAATTTPTIEPVVEITPAPIAETPIVPIEATIETQPTPEVPSAPQEDNVTTFKMDFQDETPAAEVVTPEGSAPPTPSVIDWREAVKKADKKELFAELGLDPFVVELNEHIKNGGKATDYLNAKAVDWNSVADEDVVKSDLKNQFPSFTAQEINRLYNKKYGVTDLSTEDEIADAQLMLKADAHVKRQQKIAEQANFKIPEPIQVQTQVNDNSAQQEAKLEQQRQVEATVRYFAEHEATKNLMTSKRVALNLGDNGSFNFNVERPELLMKAITDGSVWQKLTTTKQGEPDVAKMQKIALYAFNPEQFEADLVNYGKTLGLSKLVEEGQNITKGAIRTLPAHNANESEREAWVKRAKSGTLGG